MQARTNLAIDILVDVVGATLALDIVGHANRTDDPGNDDYEQYRIEPIAQASTPN